MRSKRKRQQRRKATATLRVGFPYYQQIWRDALNDLQIQLADVCQTARPDKLRFQTGRLIKNLGQRIVATGKDRLVDTMTLCYSFVTDDSLQLGYEEPRRLHFEEYKALVEIPAIQRRNWVPKRLRDKVGKLSDKMLLLVRLDSICSWMEAQESLGMWLDFNRNRSYWRSKDPDERTAAFHAVTLARVPNALIEYEDWKGRKRRGARVSEVSGLGTNSSGEPWTARRWSNILEQASRLSKKNEDGPTDFEQWVWWCYPVFSRYGWNWREVREAADKRGLSQCKETTEMELRRYWMTRGLRLSGKRRSRQRPPLAEFVGQLALPSLHVATGISIWAWFPKRLRKKTEKP
jgi:hypothetical protein